MFRYLLLLAALCFLAEPARALNQGKETPGTPERIVVLAPAAGDILLQLGLSNRVVGKTRSLEAFPEARKVGSHIKPNVELIKALRPDLLIISSNRFFSEQMSASVGAETFTYDPRSLEEILLLTGRLGFVTGRHAEASELIEHLNRQLKKRKPVGKRPKVIYEISELPLSVAGTHNIISDIIRAAGGEPVDFGTHKIIKLNPEAVLVQQPDLYIYQVGPMNQNPTPPAERGPYQRLESRFLKVDQFAWSRANTQSFDRVLELNRILIENK